MRKVLLFTLLAPPLGTLIFLGFLLGVSFFNQPGLSSVELFALMLLSLPVFAIGGYVLAIVPALIVGIFASVLHFKKPMVNYVLLIGFSAFASYLWFLVNPLADEKMTLSVVSMDVLIAIMTTAILGYFSVFKMK